MEEGVLVKHVNYIYLFKLVYEVIFHFSALNPRQCTYDYILAVSWYSGNFKDPA